MTTLLNRIGTGADFDYLFQLDDLRAMLGVFATADELEPLLELHDGETLLCRGVGEFTDADGPGVRVGAAVWCAGRQVIGTGRPVACRVTESDRRLYLHWQPEEQPLRPAGGTVNQTRASVELSAEPERDGRPGYEIVRLRWKAGRPEIDRGWWPATARVGCDERGLRVAERLFDVLPQPRTPELSFLAQRVRHARWVELLPALLRGCAGDAALSAALTAPDFAPGRSEAEWASGLLALLDECRSLPPTLAGQVFGRIVGPTRFDRGRAVTRYYFSPADLGPPRTGSVSVVVKVEVPESPSDVQLHTGGKTFTRPVNSGTAALLGTIVPGEPFEVDLPAGTLVATGLYHPAYDPPPARVPIGPSGERCRHDSESGGCEK